MALIMDYMQVRLEKVGEEVKAYAEVVKRSSEDATMKASYQREIALAPQDATDLLALYDALKAQVKTEDNLE